MCQTPETLKEAFDRCWYIKFSVQKIIIAKSKCKEQPKIFSKHMRE